MVLIAAIVGFGWLERDRLQLEAERGAGYWLGIAGMACVGLLLLYPLRKRLPKFGFMGSVPAWFQLHMALGLVAPTLILYHAGFRVGSVNAAIALASMLVVAGSGVFGRLLYVRVHRDLTTRTSEARALLVEAGKVPERQGDDFHELVDIAEELERASIKPRANVFSAIAGAISGSARVSRARRQMLKVVRDGTRYIAMSGRPAAAKALRQRLNKLVSAYCRTLKRASWLAAFERLFSLWHIMHLPLFALMLIAAMIHVVAVHQY